MMIMIMIEQMRDERWAMGTHQLNLNAYANLILGFPSSDLFSLFRFQSISFEEIVYCLGIQTS